MKWSKRIISFLLFLAIILFIFFFLLYVVQENKRLKQIIINKVAPYVPGQIGIKRIALGWFSLRLVNIELKSPDGKRQLFARDVTIELSPVKLIKTKFNPVTSVDRITIRRPVVYIYPHLLLNKKELSPASLNLNRFPINTLNVFKGKVNILNREAALFTISEISGRIELTEDVYLLDLKGQLGEAPKKIFLSSRTQNLNITGQMHSGLEDYAIEFEMRQGKIREKRKIGSGIILNSGELNFLVNLKKH
ncbi:MAG: hypothetical protein ABIA63_03100, partial [bacterium]